MISLQDFISAYYTINGCILVLGIFIGFIACSEFDIKIKDWAKYVSIVALVANVLLVMWGFVPTVLYKLAYLPLQHLVN